jgi:hypothetical protein
MGACSQFSEVHTIFCRLVCRCYAEAHPIFSRNVNIVKAESIAKNI